MISSGDWFISYPCQYMTGIEPIKIIKGLDTIQPFKENYCEYHLKHYPFCFSLHCMWQLVRNFREDKTTFFEIFLTIIVFCESSYLKSRHILSTVNFDIVLFLLLINLFAFYPINWMYLLKWLAVFFHR